MATPFLTATWSNLFLSTYAVPPTLLEPRLPPGLSLDLRDGQAFVSLVAFEFLDTRVGGIAWPGYRDFAELNLRFYVRSGNERGVVFVREFVPQRLVAWLARSLYNEPYRAAPFTATRSDGADTHAMTYELAWAGRAHTISVTADASPFRPAEDSAEHFFKEHRWGFGTTRAGRTLRTRSSIRTGTSTPSAPTASISTGRPCTARSGRSWRMPDPTRPSSPSARPSASRPNASHPERAVAVAVTSP